MREKGLAPIILVIIVAAVALGGYLLWSNYSNNKTKVAPTKQTAQVSPTPNEIANSLTITYTNKDLVFKYPYTWNISGSTLTSGSPKIKLVAVPKGGSLVNECMQKISEETKYGLVVERFTRITTGQMCSGFDSITKEIWVVPTKGVYSPGISYVYSASENKQAESIFDQILYTFKFLDSNSAENWKTYTNTKYGYQVDYPPNYNYGESHMDNYDLSGTLLGCFDIFSGPQGFEKSFPATISRVGEIPWRQLDELGNLKEGESKTYDIGEIDKGVMLRFTYTKLASKKIGGFDWISLDSADSYEQHGTSNVHYLNRNGNLYLIKLDYDGPCYGDLPLQILSTFKFTN